MSAFSTDSVGTCRAPIHVLFFLMMAASSSSRLLVYLIYPRSSRNISEHVISGLKMHGRRSILQKHGRLENLRIDCARFCSVLIRFCLIGLINDAWYDGPRYAWRFSQSMKTMQCSACSTLCLVGFCPSFFLSFVSCLVFFLLYHQYYVCNREQNPRWTQIKHTRLCLLFLHNNTSMSPCTVNGDGPRNGRFTIQGLLSDACWCFWFLFCLAVLVFLVSFFIFFLTRLVPWRPTRFSFLPGLRCEPFLARDVHLP